MPSSSNAIQRRLDLLQDPWTRFASDSRARLLRWVLTPDELCMVEVLWAKESDERAAETPPDLLLRLQAPFEDSKRHGFELRVKCLVATLDDVAFAARTFFVVEGDRAPRSSASG